MQVWRAIAEKYADFATYAAGDSPCFQEWASGVAGDRAVQAWLSALPDSKQHPTLVFAAARWHGVPAPAPYDVLRAALLGDDGSIRDTILARATQTNEAGRMATLLPAIDLAASGRPVALLEAGSSAGVCLFPDRWGYRWSTPEGDRSLGRQDRVLSCSVTGPAPLPTVLPVVGWRGGVDLDPPDLASEDAVGWLLTLVWPEDDARRDQLVRALDIVRAERPDLRRGDLLDLLPGLVDEAAAAIGPDGVVVVFHSAVIAYLDPTARRRFAAMMSRLVAAGRCRWISNEGPDVLPAVAATSPEPPPPGQFVLALDGRALAHTHGHGRSLHWEVT